jgi:hypothetical protein
LECVESERLTQVQLVEAGADDDEKGKQLGIGEVILHHGGPLDLVAVDKSQQHCNKYLKRRGQK